MIQVEPFYMCSTPFKRLRSLKNAWCMSLNIPFRMSKPLIERSVRVPEKKTQKGAHSQDKQVIRKGCFFLTHIFEGKACLCCRVPDS